MKYAPFLSQAAMMDAIWRKVCWLECRIIELEPPGQADKPKDGKN